MRELMNSEGLRVGGVYGFIKSIRRLVSVYEGARLMVFWDSKSRKRMELSEDYKAHRNRDSDNEDYRVIQMNLGLAKKVTQYMGITSAWVQGVEADDMIAHLAQVYKGVPTVIYSTDKDFFQLLDYPWVSIDRREKDDVLLCKDNMEERKGLSPLKWRIQHAILGDSSDNVPKIQGVGGTTTKQILMQIEESSMERNITNEWWSWFHNLLHSFRGTRIKRIVDNFDRVQDNFRLINLIGPVLNQVEAKSVYDTLHQTSHSKFNFPMLLELATRFEFQSMDAEYLLWFEKALNNTIPGLGIDERVFCSYVLP